MTQPTAHLPLPEFILSDGTPISAAFGDVYFSRAGGAEESRYVYLNGNGLPERFGDGFTIGELGFGTGLNLLVALEAFEKAAPAEARLHYLAVEKFPLTPAMLAEALAQHPGLAPYAAQLLAAYPERLPGLHRLHLPRATVTLAFGDVAEMLAEFDTPVDAWFLDGFAPAKNPAMWTDEVLAHLARLSAPGATVATFTAAGSVKRGLAAHGFAPEKRQGYGHKRDMLVARREDGTRKPPRPSHALVIGGGIAGCSIARSLAERGVVVTLLERGAVADGASGNPAGVLYPPLTKRWTMASAFYFAAYSFMLRTMARLGAAHAFAHASPGMLRLPRLEEEAAWLPSANAATGIDASIAAWITAEEASARCGVEVASGGLWFPQGSWLAPAEYCRALLQHERITYLPQHEAVALTYYDAIWQIKTRAGDVYAAPSCCVATANDAATLIPEYAAMLRPVGGQISVIAAEDVAAPLTSILCRKGYVVPLGDCYLTGATYHREDMLAVTEAHHATNLAELETALPGWANGKVMGGRSALRATTPDRLPMIGVVAPGLYVSLGHGSRGLLSGPFGGEIIASAMLGETPVISRAQRAAVNPLRFQRA